MTSYHETDVFSLRTEEEVESFCDSLLKLKREAPVSLEFIVALTTSRSVIYRKDLSVTRGYSEEREEANRGITAATMEAPREEPANDLDGELEELTYAIVEGPALQLRKRPRHRKGKFGMRGSKDG